MMSDKPFVTRESGGVQYLVTFSAYFVASFRLLLIQRRLLVVVLVIGVTVGSHILLLQFTVAIKSISCSFAMRSSFYEDALIIAFIHLSVCHITNCLYLTNIKL